EMAESSESNSGKISLKIKSTSIQYDIEVPEGATVSAVKQALVEKTGNPVEKHTLIFSGKILKDADTLAQHSIKDGMAIHLVIRTAPPAAAQPSSAPSTPQVPSASQPSQPQQRSPFGIPGMGAMGGGMNPMQMMQNPEMMQQMMNSPIMQSLMSNPQVLRSMLSDNPQIQQLIETNPELGHILNDPEMMRQTMEMIRNPNMFNEMMRNHDQAIRNLQGIPGGEAALQRLYQEVQEPLLNSATSSLTGNPFAALSNNANSATSRSQNAGVENAEALPNPWGGGAQGGQQANAGGTPRGGNGGMNAMMEHMMQGMMGGGAGGIGGGAMPNDIMGMMNNPAMRQMAAQMAQGLAGNPETAGLLGGIPPSALTAMGNPRVIEAMMQIQNGMEIIRTEAPDLARDMFGQSAAMMDALAAARGGAAAGAAADGTAAGAAGQNPLNALQALFGNMQMPGGAAAPLNRPVDPAQLQLQYAGQLEQLQGMGFSNVAENLAALAACFGDVNMAIERLLQR
ncbi:hypothetical protein PFISCL1PPCAC_19377, partial [Pristionchus fissidentatus]